MEGGEDLLQQRDAIVSDRRIIGEDFHSVEEFGKRWLECGDLVKCRAVILFAQERFPLFVQAVECADEFTHQVIKTCQDLKTSTIVAVIVFYI